MWTELALDSERPPASASDVRGVPLPSSHKIRLKRTQVASKYCLKRPWQYSTGLHSVCWFNVSHFCPKSLSLPFTKCMTISKWLCVKLSVFTCEVELEYPATAEEPVYVGHTLPCYLWSPGYLPPCVGPHCVLATGSSSPNSSFYKDTVPLPL